MEITVQQYLRDNVSRRYLKFTEAQYDEMLKTMEKITIIGDTVAPAAFVLGKDTPVNARYISENIATMVGGDTIPFTELVKMVGMKLNAETKKEFQALKKADINLIIVGYGGYSINTLEFLYKICVELGIKNLFKTITIFEGDNLTFTNTFRLYKNVFKPIGVSVKQSKLDVLTQNYDGVLSDKIYLVPEFMTAEVYEDSLKGKRVVFLGAPDFQTRELLKDANFIFGGHAGDDVSLISKPLVDMELTTESYGIINVATLFLNLLRATFELPKALTCDFPENTVLFDYNYRTELEVGNVKSPYKLVVDPNEVEPEAEPEAEPELTEVEGE